jgi:RNA polymerase-binding transcription factor DksA
MDTEETTTSTTAPSTQRKLCSLCGQPIAPARLEALPGVTTCIACAKKHPRKVDISGIELSQASPINRNGFAPKD